jgi:hypothetical protein
LKAIPLPPFWTIVHPFDPLNPPFIMDETAPAFKVGGKKRDSKAIGIKINALVKRVNLCMRTPA